MTRLDPFIESEGYIIHARPYRETSLLLMVLTQHGTVSLISKGARGPRSPYKGLLQPFQHLLLQWKSARALGNLYQVDLLYLDHPTSQIARLAGLYMNELLYKLSPSYDIPATFFQHYQDTLKQLNTVSLETALRYFEKNLLAGIGYGLDCSKDKQGNALLADCFYRYHPTEGFFLGPEGKDSDFWGASIMALGQNALRSNHLKEAKRLLRWALAVQLNGKVLMSRELVRGGAR